MPPLVLAWAHLDERQSCIPVDSGVNSHCSDQNKAVYVLAGSSVDTGNGNKPGALPLTWNSTWLLLVQLSPW